MSTPKSSVSAKPVLTRTGTRFHSKFSKTPFSGTPNSPNGYKNRSCCTSGIRGGQEDASLAARDAISQAGHTQGILHCCNGHEGLVEAGLELGWYVSFAGNLTYKSAKNLQTAAKLVPEERLLVETDSPYLSPEPRRGRPNVPANVRYTAAFLAELRVTLARLEPVLDANARQVYGLPD